MNRNGNGQFAAFPLNGKTPKMLEVERMLGRTLEEDYLEYYVRKGMGQKRMSHRWQTPRQIIFGAGKNSKRTTWVKRLNLPIRNEATRNNNVHNTEQQKPPECEVCNVQGIPLQKAHWVASASGGELGSHNIIKLCPNCHCLLDSGDSAIENKVKATLLFRETAKVINNGLYHKDGIEQLLNISEAIILRKPLKK